MSFALSREEKDLFSEVSHDQLEKSVVHDPQQQDKNEKNDKDQSINGHGRTFIYLLFELYGVFHERSIPNFIGSSRGANPPWKGYVHSVLIRRPQAQVSRWVSPAGTIWALPQ